MKIDPALKNPRRDRAVDRLLEILKDSIARSEAEAFVDDVITAARLPLLTAHELAVEDLRRQQREERPQVSGDTKLRLKLAESEGLPEAPANGVAPDPRD